MLHALARTHSRAQRHIPPLVSGGHAGLHRRFTPERLDLILARLEAFDQFNNDSQDQHDLAVIDRERCLPWKIDYYDQDMELMSI